MARALISLQQTSLELTQDERLLACIPINDQCGQEIVDRLNRRYAWPVAIGSSVTWVSAAFIFTLIDSFVSLGSSPNSVSEGHAVGTLWLWFLCLVIGWLWVPTFTCGELKSGIGYANQKAAKKAAKRIKQMATKTYHNAKAKVTNIVPKRTSTREGSKKSAIDPVPEADEKDETVTVEVIQVDSKPVGPNYSVVSLPCSTAVNSIAAQSSIDPETDRLSSP